MIVHFGGGVSGEVHKVLYVAHNHPSIRPGGMEMYADELYQAIREAGEFEPVFVSKVGPPHSIDAPHQETRFSLADGDPNLYYFYTQTDEFDRLLGTARRKRMYTEDWRAFLEVQRPDIVHFHHATWLGYDIVRETRRALPDAAIVYTLHDFNPICQHAGQMVRRETLELCYEASPRRCHQCFPKISTQKFFLREQFIKSAFRHVDMFITPSDHARHRYIEWGLPADKVVHEDYGRFPVEPLPDPPQAGARKRIGFFGQMTEYKGVDVLLEAMRILQRQGCGAQLLLRGANLELQRPEFQEGIRSLLDQTADSVRFTGAYSKEELPGLLSAIDWTVVPSIWWETGPLVIHESLMHRRPVICSDIGSMVERIHDGINGLRFRVGDPYSLADTIRQAVETPGLWEEIRSRIGEPHSMDEHLPVISGIYNQLLDRAMTSSPAAP